MEVETSEVAFFNCKSSDGGDKDSNSYSSPDGQARSRVEAIVVDLCGMDMVVGLLPIPFLCDISNDIFSDKHLNITKS